MTTSKFKISNKVLSVLLCAAMLLSYVPISSLTAFAAVSSVEISSLSELQLFESRVEDGETSLNAVLTANIDMSSVTDWNGIGTQTAAYSGTFDGQGYTLSNLTGSMGLFAESSGTVKNVYIKNVSIDGGGNNGAVVGHNMGTVLNCVSTGTVHGNSWSVGGIVGYNEGGAVLGCISSCTVSGGTAGGLIGSNWSNGHISYCYYSGTNANIEGDSNYAKASSEAVYFQTGSGYQLYNNDSAVSAETVVTTVNTYITNNGGYFKLSTLENTVLFPHASHPVCGVAHTEIGNHTGECGNITWTAWESSDTLPTEAGNYYLTGNVNLGSVVWDVPSGETKICLNGKELRAKKISIASGNTLTISDCGETGTVKRNGGFGQSGTIVENTGTFNLYGGSITSNTNWYGYGGGVINNGTFNMYGGAVTKNSADRMGGGVYNKSGATFNLYGGSITKNSGGTGGGLYNAGKFNMYGGGITGNKTDMDSYGGIYSANRINISGKVVISGNTDKNGDPSNYCSTNNGAVLIVGTLEAGSSIGVTRYKNIGTITTGGDEYIDYFFSDNAQYFVEKDGENLKLSEKEFTVDVTVNDNAYGTASANKTSGTKGTQVLLTAEPAEGYRLKEWKLISGGGSLYQSGIFYIGTENAEIQAVFEQAASYTVQFNTAGGTGSKDSVTVFEGDSYILPANPFTPPTGKQFKAWSVGDNEYAVGDKITVFADTTVTAVWENIPAETPTVTAGENLTLTYKGYTDKQVSVTVTKKDGYTYSYQWYDSSKQPINGATDSSYTVPNDLTVGSYDYYCVVTAKRDDNNDTATAERKSTVTVNKATATLTAPTAQNEITYGAKLSTVGLNDDWGWANGDTVPTVKNNGYVAYYTPADTDNYDWTTIDGWNATENRVERTVPVTVKKATLTVKAKDKTITYGEAPTNNGVTYSGFVTGESETELGGTLEYDYSYTQYGDVGMFDITPKGLSSDNYAITFENGILTVKQKELGITWSNAEFTYDGTAHKPTATTTDFVSNDNVALTVSGEQTDANKDGESYTAAVTITGAKAGNYKFAEGAATTTQFTIKKADQTAPVGLTKADTTYFGKADGKIFGLTSAMEYRKEGDSTYVAGINGTLEYLEAGNYYVRYQGDSNHLPSPETAITVGEGRKLQIVVPQNPVGYTVTVNKTEMEYEGSYTLKVEINEGYTATEDFKIIISNWECGQQPGVEETYMNAIADQIIEVQGVADTTAPDAEISITTNKWTTFLDTITFGLFFKETQDVTITAVDKGSGPDKIYYYISEDVLTEAEVKALAADKWTPYDAESKLSIAPDKKCVVYAKAADKAQNVKFISSTGLVTAQHPHL